MMGTTELIVILIIAVVLFGPERLPELSRSIARAINEFQNSIREPKRKEELAG
ncbi:MAG TPA: twin-arginine translocase TatA/TatE family subunit [Candidatus Altiarchaeales archaeon]|nr:twin-arginine translocase TatA/TatE family subunit [Candidatus Altiarchaeales archaeon]